MKSYFVKAAVVAAGLGLAGTALAQDMRVVVVSHGQASDPFWSVVKNGVDQAAQDLGVTVEYRAPDTFDMVTALEQAKHQVAATDLTLRYGPFHVGLPAGIFGAGPKRRFTQA